MLACLGRRDLRSNDLFDRANQRVVGLIGRVRPRNSPYGRAQRGRTKSSAGAAQRAAIGCSDWLELNIYDLTVLLKSRFCFFHNVHWNEYIAHV